MRWGIYLLSDLSPFSELWASIARRRRTLPTQKRFAHVIPQPTYQKRNRKKNRVTLRCILSSLIASHYKIPNSKSFRRHDLKAL
ncbi:hypothetical protein NPIL_674371, partial [Nephila pilipes]